MRKSSHVFTGFLACISSGCSMVPPLEEATGTTNSPVLISQVVQRVKCEIADALADKISQPDYMWMDGWTAKVDLTLQANSQGGVTPGVTYTQYFRNAFNFAAGPTSLTNNNTIAAVNQFFSIGAGANLGEQAIRAEVVSFTVSLRELKNWKYPPRGMRSDFDVICVSPPGFELTGNLGLKEWVNSALYPVSNYDLQAGNHPSPVTAAKPSLSPVAHVTQYEGGPTMPYADAVRRLSDANSAASAALKDATSNAKKIASYISQIHRAISPYLAVMEPNLRRGIEENLRDLEEFGREAKTAVDDITPLQKVISNTYKLILNDSDHKNPVSTIVTNAEDQAGKAVVSQNFSDDVTGEADKIANALQKIDPPVDSLLHSVEFIVSYGVSITPNWTLLQWKGPSPSGGSALSASGGRTNILNIALGPVSGVEQNRLIQNQTVLSSTTH
jgi:hypothetical protein